MLHIKKIKVLNDDVLVTGDKYEEDMYDNGLIVANKGDLKLYQKVIAVGSIVRDIEVGNQVMFDPSRFAKMKYDKNSLQNDLDNNRVVKWDFPWITIDDEQGNPKDCLRLTSRDIQFVFEGEERNEKIMMPKGKKIQLN